MKNCRTIQSVLHDFYKVLGLKVNLRKSRMCFSKNTPSHLRDSLANELGMSHRRDIGKYLGVFIKENYKAVDFQFLINALRQQIQCWNSNFLSIAGHLVLSKLVLSTLPNYHITVSRVFNTISKNLNHVVRNFLWNGKDKTSKLVLVKWENVTLPLSIGILGIKDFRLVNLALLGKLAWNVIF